MKKIAQGIVRFRKLILTVAFLLLIPSAIGAVATRINYDILTYLPQDLDSMIGEVALEDDFHLASTGMITVEGLPTNELIAMKKDIEAVPGVMQTFWLSDVIDPSIPTEMLPADVQQFMFGKNDSTMLIVRFDAPSASDETMNAVSQIEKLLRKDCFFGGMSVILQDTKALVNQEMPLYILIAVGASLLVLFLSLESTITPLLFMLGCCSPSRTTSAPTSFWARSATSPKHWPPCCSWALPWTSPSSCCTAIRKKKSCALIMKKPWSVPSARP